MAALDGSALAGGEPRVEPAARPPRSSRGAMDWDDVRMFLAVAREGSMRAAGRALGLSQPTIARRLAAFEATFGGPSLFDRLPEGLRLNAAGEQLVPAAESVEGAVLTLERRRAAASPVLSGTVRVSTGECAAGFLARCLSEPTTTALPSGITLELVDELRQTANLVRRQADMALRHDPPEGGDFYISKAGTFACAVYRRRGAAADAWVTFDNPSPRTFFEDGYRRHPSEAPPTMPSCFVSRRVRSGRRSPVGPRRRPPPGGHPVDRGWIGGR